MTCEEFEESLTDYLDGFLPAHNYHRWERHAALCDRCTELPVEVPNLLLLHHVPEADHLVDSNCEQRATIGQKSKTGSAAGFRPLGDVRLIGPDFLPSPQVPETNASVKVSPSEKALIR